jgi:hypothetical protein
MAAEVQIDLRHRMNNNLLKRWLRKCQDFWSGFSQLDPEETLFKYPLFQFPVSRFKPLATRMRTAPPLVPYRLPLAFDLSFRIELY